ncbi:myb-like domain, Myb/SANT-like DNA-binding domain protein [Artemisia annua]|uniref:Myb-like domain, Myb/SANT-like DNA-binding domain protein n=1 Tax=Artemisia annua TaxID=35608 RepID=A0A2U1N3H5_ARTAN|nr:myb-like domain, Myb/SANT-like DNA-binding domain protein [Artemisia annua]
MGFLPSFLTPYGILSRPSPPIPPLLLPIRYKKPAGNSRFLRIHSPQFTLLFYIIFCESDIQRLYAFGFFLRKPTHSRFIADSGCNDIQVLERANRDFEKQHRKTFSHSKAWYVLKDQAKWKERPLVSQTKESTGSNKKRKSSESSSAQTPTNETPINVEDFECELPNLNENPTPSRQFKRQKKGEFWRFKPKFDA